LVALAAELQLLPHPYSEYFKRNNAIGNNKIIYTLTCRIPNGLEKKKKSYHDNKLPTATKIICGVGKIIYKYKTEEILATYKLSKILRIKIY